MHGVDKSTRGIDDAMLTADLSKQTRVSSSFALVDHQSIPVTAKPLGRSCNKTHNLKQSGTFPT